MCTGGFFILVHPGPFSPWHCVHPWQYRLLVQSFMAGQALMYIVSLGLIAATSEASGGPEGVTWFAQDCMEPGTQT